MEMMKRAIHLDFHTMPGIYDFEETFAMLFSWCQETLSKL